MFNIGGMEFVLIAAIAILVIGPKELPTIMYTLGRVVRRIQYVRYAFTQQFEDFLREHELHDINRQVNFEVKHFDEAAADEDQYVEERKVGPDDQ